MVDVMGYVFLIWLLPVVIQIVFPLCMLAGWLTIQLVNSFKRNCSKPVVESEEKFALNGVNQKS